MKKKSPSQVLARVNGTEITVHQLNFMLRAQQKVDNAQKQQALENLVDQELMLQKAIELKLDRDPMVLQTLEASKRQILAQAAAERVFSRASEPTPSIIDTFYREHPELFEKRKQYHFDAFLISAAEMKDSLRQQLNEVKTAVQVQAVLSAGKISYQQKETVLMAEQLPMPVLGKAAGMQVGDVLALPEGSQVLLMQLRASREVPMERSDAEAAIRHYIKSTEDEKQVSNKLATMRGGAKIEYLTRYQNSEKNGVSMTKQGVLSQESIQSGVKGLK